MYDFEIRAKDAVVDALQEMTYHEVNGEGLSYGTSWQLVGEADYLVAYKQPDPTNSSITVGRVFGRVRADIDDVMGLFYSETSEDYLKVSQLLHNRTHDARVLSVIRKRGPTTSPYSFLGTKYLCAEPVAGIPARDQVMVEYMGYAQDSKGRAIGFHATLPLNPQEAPPLGSTMRVPRVRVTNVLLVRALENHPGHCAVFTTGSFDLRESSSNMTLFIRKYMDNLRDVSVLMDSRRISSEQLLGKHSWVPDSLRKSCYVCTRSFGPTRHRHHCRLCGEVVCRKCLVAREVMASGEDGRAGMTKLKVCMFCVQKTRSKTSKSSFGLPGTAMDRSGSPTHTFAHTITSSMDRTSFTSDAYSDASSQFSFDIGFEIRSPSRRYSDMSVATTIFERDDASIADSFAADLYIDTHDMEPAYQPRMPPQYVPQQRPMMSSSPRSSKSSSSGRSGGSSGHSGYSNGYPRQPSLQYQKYPRTSAYDRDREHHQESQRFINDIGQQLAEQQEILRRLALASSSNNNRPSHDFRQRY